MSTRSEREKEIYNQQGLKRKLYEKILKHCNYYWYSRYMRKTMNALLNEGGRKCILEIGASSWIEHLEDQNILSHDLHCINISEVELQTGIKQSEHTKIKPKFYVMDAHKLDFPDQYFDLIFGGGILHHLDLEQISQQMKVKLKPGGKFVFIEPLNINPISKIVRYLTPKARTADEIPFTFKEINMLKEQFNIQVYGMEMFSVPLGIVSGLLFKSPENWLNKLAYKLDRFLLAVLPPTKYLCRSFILVGRK